MEAIEAIKSAHTNLGYDEFCKYMGIGPDQTAFKLFTNLRQVAEGLGAFDANNLAKLIAYKKGPRPAA